MDPGVSPRGLRRRLVANSVKTPSMSKKALPAAVAVSAGCSVAFRVTPFALGAGQPVDAGDRQGVARVQELQQGVELARPAREVPVLFSVRRHRRLAGTQGLLLEGEVLVGGGDTGLAVVGHGRATLFDWGSDPPTLPSEMRTLHLNQTHKPVRSECSHRVKP